MKIVILDGYTTNPGDLTWTDMRALADEFTCHDRTALTEIRDRIGAAEIVVTNKTPLTKEIIADCPKLRYIGVLATGYNVVDTEAAAAQGIVVTNIPAYGTNAVAQYTIGLLLEACLHIGAHSRSVKEGRWTRSIDWCYWDHPLMELFGKTLGIIGFGKIGRATAKIARALGMEVLAFSRTRHPEHLSEGIRYATLDEVLSKSDVISLHCPLFPETEGIINRENLSKTKKGVIILNTARGGLIVEQDVADALHSGQIGHFAADVVSTEPIAADNPLLGAPNCLLTPHIAWAPFEARERLMGIAVNNVRQFLAGEPVNVVNI